VCTRAEEVLKRLQRDRLYEAEFVERTSIELQPLLAAIKDPDHFEILTPELQKQLEAEEAEALKMHVPETPAPASGLVGTNGDDNNGRFLFRANVTRVHDVQEVP
jgi:hypothetical protein